MVTVLAQKFVTILFWKLVNVFSQKLATFLYLETLLTLEPVATLTIKIGYCLVSQN